jgi:uncharacterized protein (TIGR02145 family)
LKEGIMRMQRIFFLCLLITLFYSCKKKVDPQSEFIGTEDVGVHYIICKGEAMGDKIIERGFCWSTNNTPTVFDNKIAVGAGGGSYIARIDSLMPNTDYYVRAYCASRLKISYSNEKIIRTTPSPTVSTFYPCVVTTNSFLGGGNIAGITGMSNAGVCYGQNPYPTISNSIVSTPLTPGTFSVNLTGLLSNNTYFYRTFVVIGEEVFYGKQVAVKTFYSTVADIDGNIYYTVKIGTQEWMAENLKVEHYQNGIPISYCDRSLWISAPIPGGMYGNFNNYVGYKSTHGHLYDGAVITNSVTVAPFGWHVPSNYEWSLLENFLGGPLVAGGKMIKPNCSEVYDEYYHDNSSGFSALMGGERTSSGQDYGLAPDGYTTFWTSSFDFSFSYSFVRTFEYTSPESYGGTYNSPSGLYIRCLKN